MNIFYTDHSYIEAAKIVADLSVYCESGIFTVESKNFETLKKSTVDLRNRHAQHYYMHVEIEFVENNKSKVSIYNLLNNSQTKQQAIVIESWLNNKSTECVPRF
ncbi:hypothetical protein [Endozoicomonas sp. ALE010]|uniref:hypothetical protein n=1 Tax=Endozoicomonas sp. ALE010 TaxID=3403081 RepID=UPI003BB5B5CA